MADTADHKTLPAKASSDRADALDSIARAPFAAALGLQVISAENGAAAARMPFSPGLLNEGGEGAPIHGGAIASLADFAACLAVWSLPQTRRSATVTMTVNYTAPGIRSTLTAHARVRASGRHLAHVTVEIRDRDDALIAEALVTYKLA